MSENEKDNLEEVPISRSLVPPEAKLNGITELEDQPQVSSPIEPITPKLVTEITTPNTAKETPDNKSKSTTSSSKLEPIDLNIVNLESSNDLRIDERARSSPSFKDFGKDITERNSRRTASTSNLPVKPEDPEDRIANGRQYSLDLCAAPPDHVIIEIEQERARKGNERKFKIIMGLLIFATLFTVTFFMMAYELGYLEKGDSFSTPVFY